MYWKAPQPSIKPSWRTRKIKDSWGKRRTHPISINAKIGRCHKKLPLNRSLVLIILVVKDIARHNIGEACLKVFLRHLSLKLTLSSFYRSIEMITTLYINWYSPPEQTWSHYISKPGWTQVLSKATDRKELRGQGIIGFASCCTHPQWLIGDCYDVELEDLA